MLSHLYRHYRHLCPKFLPQSGSVHRQVALRHAGTLFRKCGVLHIYDCAGNDQAQEHARNNGGIRYAPLCEICPFQRGHPVLAALIMPFAILSNTLLFIAGPFGLLALLFFNLNFVALGSSYTPTEELLDKEEEQEEAIKANAKRKKQSQKKRQKSPMTTRWMISTIRPNCQKKEGNSSRKVLTGGVPKWATKTALPIC